MASPWGRGKSIEKTTLSICLAARKSKKKDSGISIFLPGAGEARFPPPHRPRVGGRMIGGCQPGDSQPVFNLQSRNRPKIGVGSQENEPMLARQGGNQQVELGQHLAGRAEFLEKISEFHGCLLVRWPEAEDREGSLWIAGQLIDRVLA